MSSMLIAFNGTTAMGQFLGDTIVSIKTAYLFAQNTPCSRILLALSPKGELNFLWSKFIETHKCQVIYDNFHPGNMDQRFAAWDRWRKTREIDGVKFDHFRELYRRIDGGHRQGTLCGSERGLGRKNIFEYLFYGQENQPEFCLGGDTFEDTLIAHPELTGEYGVLLSPYAKCQGNGVFTYGFWERVVRQLVGAGIQVTVNHNQNFCEDLRSNPLYRRIFPSFPDLLGEVCRHRVVACGNTGIGWLAGACGVPLIAGQPPDSNMQDYRYEWCGHRSMVEFIEGPDVAYWVRRVSEEVVKVVVLTTGCFDLLHAGHIRHLEESRALGSRLIVALNSDASVKKLKGTDRPLRSQDDRELVLRALRFVDEVRVFDSDNALKVIEQVRPGILTNGPDHRPEEVVGRSFVEGYGGRVVITGGDRTVSTTSVLNLARERDLLTATIGEAARHSPNPHQKLRALANQYLSVRSVEGQVADVGTYRGACGLIFRRLGPERNLHLFDTWKGNPFEDPLCHHRPGEWAASLADCKNLIGENDRTFYHEGVFPKSAAKLEDLRFAFVLIDVDTYQSTKDALAWFWPRLVKGGKLFLDDFNWTPCAGVKKAVEEAFEPRQCQIFPEVFACVLTKETS